MTAERRHHHRRENAGHDGQKHTSTPGGSQRTAKNDDRQHRAKRELQSDRLVHQRQNRDDDAVGHTPRHRNRP